MLMSRPKIHKRNPLNVTELDAPLMTPNEARELGMLAMERHAFPRYVYNSRQLRLPFPSKV